MKIRPSYCINRESLAQFENACEKNRTETLIVTAANPCCCRTVATAGLLDAFTFDTEAAFLDLHLSISNDIVSTKIYDNRDDFHIEIANFPFLDCDAPRSTSYGVYISQLIRFASASSHVANFNTRNKLLTQKLLKR